MKYYYQILEHCILNEGIDKDKGWDIAYDRIIERYPSLKDFYEEGVDVQFFEACDHGWCKGMSGNSYLYAFYISEEIPDGMDAEDYLIEKYSDITKDQIGYAEEDV